MALNGRRTVGYLKKVIRWFEDHDYEVIFRHGIRTCIDPYGSSTTKLVHIDSNPSKEFQLHSLLHEAGHHIISCEPDYAKQFSHGYSAWSNDASDPRCRTVMHWVHVIAEEYAAWDEGLTLATELGIPIRSKRWEINRCSSLITYMRDVATFCPKGKKPRGLSLD
jgi:hypothetical protein